MRTLWVSVAVWLLLAGGVTTANAGAPAAVDLNGDGRSDRVSVEFDDREGRYTVEVNEARFSAYGLGLRGQFSVVDVDTTDRFLEIAVPEDGESSDWQTTFLRYDGHSVKSVGTLPGTFNHSLRVDGSGVVHTKARSEFLQTWFYPVAYTVSKSLLAPIVQDYYPMGTRCRARLRFPLFARPAGEVVIGTIASGDSVTIVACDLSRWCIAQMKDGTWGWFQVLEGRITPPGVLASELLEGLSRTD